jgi:hypothetical protein
MKKRVFCPYYKYSKKTLQIAALFYFYFFGFLMVSWGNWCPNFDLYDNLNPKSNPPWPNFLNHQQRKPNDLTICWCSKRVLTNPIVFVIFGPKWVLYDWYCTKLLDHKLNLALLYIFKFCHGELGRGLLGPKS